MTRDAWRVFSPVCASLTYTVQPGGPLRGTVRVPGDKSISHRAAILGALAQGPTEIRGMLAARDTLATLDAFRSMGVAIEGPHDGRVTIEGVGRDGLEAPAAALDLGNSGTAIRLLPGVLAAQPFAARLIGDESLMRRPMRRITEPLTAMGACIRTSDDGTPPIEVEGRPGGLRGIDYAMPVASAQVKSCLLLAGLYARGETRIVEKTRTRDHTERMLRAFGYRVGVSDAGICVQGGAMLSGTTVDVPGDLSAAAFFLIGALLADGSELWLEGVGINPSRCGVLEILRRMGGDIAVRERRRDAMEPIADIQVRSSRLRGITIPPHLVALAIDEFPAIFVAAACAQGETRLSGAAELRVKESDRIEVMANGLRTLGVDARASADGMIIAGGTLDGGRVQSAGDHRVAMAFAMAGVRSRRPVVVEHCENVDTSFPGFVESARAVGLSIEAGESG